MSLQVGQSIRGYELKELIGVGGFANVYRATRHNLGTDVVIKVIKREHANKPDFIRRFEVEAQMVARLEHLHIVPLYDYWRDPDGAYLVMRWLRGGSLSDILKAQSNLSIEETVLMVEQVARALNVAHRNNVIHRDIKPANILLDEDSNAYLADFGIAKDTTTTGHTQADSIIGSIPYISPEQVNSELVTPQSDIYSLGIVLYEVLEGKHPYGKDLSVVEWLVKHINAPMPDLTALDDSIWDAVNNVIQKATAKDPNKRFDDVLQMARALREAAALDRSQVAENLVALLTPREQEVMKLMIEGKSNREIAEEMVIEVSTVKWYVNQIYKKLSVRSRTQAIVKARELDLIVDDFQISTGIESLPEPINPYKGLRAFESADEHQFFGRDKLVKKLLKRLSESGFDSRFLAVVGPSGSGKSSVAKAGLIPALWRGELQGSDNWYIVDMLPGNRPLDKLEVALLRIAGDHNLNLREQLERDDGGLMRIADLILPDDGSELLLVIDQFEEVFTLLEDETQRQCFLNLLYTAVTESRSRVRVVVTLRADYYDRPLHYSEFGELMRNRVETVLPLGAEELEMAIREPALQAGVNFEPGLVSRIVSDVNYQPGALPLMQYALTELFERRDKLTLTQAAYQEIGGTGGALAKRADEIYMEYHEEGRELIQQMFLRLVTLGEGAEDTRRRAARAEMLTIATNPELMDEIIDTYARSRLLSLDNDPATRQPMIEVAHEAILREWKRLREWLNVSREDIKQERQVAQAAESWQEHNQDKSFLWSGARLNQAEKWQQETQLSQTPLVTQFIAESIGQREAENQAEAERVEREKAQEQRSQTLLRALVAIFALAAVISGGFGLFALNQRNEATLERDNAQSLVWAFQARAINNVNYPMALSLALESVKIDDPSPQAESIFREIASDDALQSVIAAHSYQVTSLAVTPDSTILISSSCAELRDDSCQIGEIAAWDLSSKTELWRITSHQGWVNTVVMKPDGQSFLAGACGLRDEDGNCVRGDMIEYAVATGELMSTSAVHTDAVTALLYDPNNQHILIGTADGALKLWDIELEEFVQTLAGHKAAIRHMVFNTDSTMLLSGDDAGMLYYWLLEDATPIWNTVAHKNAITGLTVGDTFVITTSKELSTARWDLETGELLEKTVEFSVPCCAILHPNQASVYIIVDEGASLRAVDNMNDETDSFGVTNALFRNPEIDAVGSPTAAIPIFNTSTIVLGDDAGNLKIWKLSAATPITELQGESYNRLDIHPDGKQMVLSSNMGTLEFWDIDPQSETYSTILFTTESDLPAGGFVEYNADGNRVAWGTGDWSGSGESRLYLVDTANGDILHSFDASQHKYILRAIALTPDETRIVTGSQSWPEPDGDLIVWDTATGEMLAQYPLEFDVTWIATIDDERVLLSSVYGERVRLFNIATGEVERVYDAPYAVMTTWYSEERQQVFSGLGNGTIVSWDFDSAEPQNAIVIDYNEFIVSDVSENGRYALLGGKQGVLVDLEKGISLDRFNHPAQPWGVAFSPDMQSVWTIDLAGFIKQWSIVDQPLDELITWAEDNRYMHEPTCEERENYRIGPLCDVET